MFRDDKSNQRVGMRFTNLTVPRGATECPICGHNDGSPGTLRELAYGIAFLMAMGALEWLASFARGSAGPFPFALFHSRHH